MQSKNHGESDAIVLGSGASKWLGVQWVGGSRPESGVVGSREAAKR